jgi:hypothetical protein
MVSPGRSPCSLGLSDLPGSPSRASPEKLSPRSPDPLTPLGPPRRFQLESPETSGSSRTRRLGSLSPKGAPACLAFSARLRTLAFEPRKRRTIFSPQGPGTLSGAFQPPLCLSPRLSFRSKASTEASTGLFGLSSCREGGGGPARFPFRIPDFVLGSLRVGNRASLGWCRGHRSLKAARPGPRRHRCLRSEGEGAVVVGT